MLVADHTNHGRKQGYWRLPVQENVNTPDKAFQLPRLTIVTADRLFDDVLASRYQFQSRWALQRCQRKDSTAAAALHCRSTVNRYNGHSSNLNRQLWYNELAVEITLDLGPKAHPKMICDGEGLTHATALSSDQDFYWLVCSRWRDGLVRVESVCRCNTTAFCR